MKPWLIFIQTSDVIDMLDEPEHMIADCQLLSLCLHCNGYWHLIEYNI